MNICLTVNSKYMRYTYIMLQTLYENNDRGSVDLYILQRDFTEKDKEAIEDISKQFSNRVYFIWMDPKWFDDMPLNLIEGTTLSMEIFFRLLIPEVLPMLDRVLMLDVDIVINGSLKKIYNIDMDNVCLAAAPNLCTGKQVPINFRNWYPRNRTKWMHYNTGVLLWNLKYFRENYPEKYILEQAKKSKIGTMAFEEELFNILFGENEILELDPFQWNYITTYEDILRGKFRYHLEETVEELRKNHSIIHFLGSNPWGTGFKNESYRIWWEYAEKTPYYHDICKEQIEKVEFGQSNEKISLGYKVTILEKLLRIKGTGKLREIIRQGGIQHIYLYGAGVMAELFYIVLCADQVQELVEGVYDKRIQGEFQGLPIVYPDAKEIQCIGECYTDGRSIIFVTPSYETEEIKTELLRSASKQVEVLTLKDLLE